jgi:hypothetical protein
MVRPDPVLALRFAVLLAAVFAGRAIAIDMDGSTPESAYRAKGNETLGFPGRPLNVFIYRPALRLNKPSRATAALLSPKWVLTAGHAIIGETYLIGLGTNVLYDTDHRIRVRRTFLHPQFQNWMLPFDIALMELETPIAGFPPAILGGDPVPADKEVISAGFGLPGRNMEGITLGVGFSGWLRGWVTDYDASSNYPETRFSGRYNYGNFLSAHGCGGDSGSPAWIWDAALGVHKLIGIAASSGDPECSRWGAGSTSFSQLTTPAVHDWIASVTSLSEAAPTLSLSLGIGTADLRLPAAVDASLWLIEESPDLRAWSGAFPFVDGVCRRPLGGDTRFWRAYQPAPNPLINFSNQVDLGTAREATGKDIVAGVPGAIAGDGQNRAIRTSKSKIGGNVVVPHHVSLNPTGSFSVEIWAKPAQTAEFTHLFGSYAPEETTGNFGGWRLVQGSTSTAGDGGGFGFDVFNTSGDAATTLATAPAVIQPDTWYHLVGVHDGTQVELYVNGSKAAATSLPEGHSFRPNPWAGMLVGGSYYWYLGELDEPAIYPRALTAAEVLEHYQAGAAATPAVSYRAVVLGDGPIGYWPLDDAPAAPAALAAPVSAFLPTRGPAPSTEEFCCGGGLPPP